MEQYSRMVGLVMSYSFSDPEEDDPLKQTMMVPVIDLLNHHSNHHAELTFHEKYLLLSAVRDIRKVRDIGITEGVLKHFMSHHHVAVQICCTRHL